MSKRIVVVGIGAVGGYIAAHLAKAGHNVTAVDPWPEHVETIRKQGLDISGMTDAEHFIQPVQALHLTDVQHLSKEDPVDIAIVAMKSYDTKWATAMIAPYLSAQGYVVSAQNSINEEAIASVVGFDRTVGCIVGNNYAVDLYEPGRIRRTMPKGGAYACLQVGEVHGSITPRVQELAQILSSVDKSEPTRNLWGVRWSKLVVNGMRNGVSAATGLGGNERDSHERIRRVVIKLAGEAVRVGQGMGLVLEKIAGLEPHHYAGAAEGDQAALATVEKAMLDGTKGTARSHLQRPSMAQDMAKGRRTEIDFMNGMIAAKGRSVGRHAPTHEGLTEAVKKVERGEMAAKPENLYHLLPNR